MTERTQGLLRHLNRPVDGASLAVFRIIFGLLVTLGALRFLSSGWHDAFFVQPSFFFTFDFAPGVQVASPATMTALVAVLAVLGAMVAAGLFYRFATLGLCVIFTYLELTDVTNYLNHYYQVCLLSLLLCVMPLHRVASLDARRRPDLRVTHFPGWMRDLLRFQVGLVYVFAALAKLNSDWLLHAQPLNIWLLARTDTPVIGGWLGSFDVALAMSWGGFLHDLFIVPALLWRRTRPLAYGVLVVFHGVTGMLFNIGLFPWIMVGTTTVFFAPDWPRRLVRRRAAGPVAPVPSRPSALVAKLRPWSLALVLLWGSVQVGLPLRAYAYEGPTNWHEQGMRFAWRVMVREKNGSVTYRVSMRGRHRPRLVPPAAYLSAAQEREMSGQPDLILQLAHHIGRDFRGRGFDDVEVRVDAWVSWNGRPPARLIDPDVDLLGVEVSFFESAAWILPAPTSPPIRLEAPPFSVTRSPL